MPKRSSTPARRQKAVDQLHRAVQNFVEACGGDLWVIEPLTITPHNPTQFDIVIPCVGKRPQQQDKG
jgi:hypothetical protein